MVDLILAACVLGAGWYAYRNRVAVKAWIVAQLAKLL